MTSHWLIQLVLGLSFPGSPNSLLWLHNTTPAQVKYSLSTCYASGIVLSVLHTHCLLFTACNGDDALSVFQRRKLAHPI